MSHLNLVENIRPLNDNVFFDEDAASFDADAVSFDDDAVSFDADALTFSNFFDLAIALDGIDFLIVHNDVIIVALVSVVGLVVLELLETNLEFISLQAEKVGLMFPVVSILLQLSHLKLQRLGLVPPMIPVHLELNGVQIEVLDLATHSLHDVIQRPHLLDLALDDVGAGFKVFRQHLKIKTMRNK